jgi:hypothetical protein
VSYPSSGGPWQQGQPDPNQPQYGGYSGGPGSDPYGVPPQQPQQPQYGAGPAYPDQQQYGGQAYPQQESYTTEPPYSGQPYSGQPYAAQQPYSGQPYDGGYGAQQPGYEQAGYQAAGYQQPAGYQQAGYQQQPYAAPPQPSRGRGGMIALIAGAAFLLLLVCGVGGVLIMRSGDEDPDNVTQSPGASANASADDNTSAPPTTPTVKGEYPAKIVLGDKVAGMNRLKDASLQSSADKTATELKNDTNADTAVAGYYAPADDPTKIVGIIGATTRISDPEQELDDAFGSSSLSVTGVQEFSAGSLGGYVKCGNTSSGGNALTICGWADGGSLAIGIFIHRSLNDSQTLFQTIRKEILIRG